MTDLFETNGLDLKKIIEEARANGRTDVAEAIESKIADFQKVYDFLGARYTICPDVPVWNVDPEALKSWEA